MRQGLSIALTAGASARHQEIRYAIAHRGIVPAPDRSLTGSGGGTAASLPAHRQKAVLQITVAKTMMTRRQAGLRERLVERKVVAAEISGPSSGPTAERTRVPRGAYCATGHERRGLPPVLARSRSSRHHPAGESGTWSSTDGTRTKRAG